MVVVLHNSHNCYIMTSLGGRINRSKSCCWKYYCFRDKQWPCWRGVVFSLELTYIITSSINIVVLKNLYFKQYISLSVDWPPHGRSCSSQHKVCALFYHFNMISTLVAYCMPFKWFTKRFCCLNVHWFHLYPWLITSLEWLILKVSLIRIWPLS